MGNQNNEKANIIYASNSAYWTEHEKKSKTERNLVSIGWVLTFKGLKVNTEPTGHPNVKLDIDSNLQQKH